jgi:DNA-binding transcriptional MerR regulator
LAVWEREEFIVPAVVRNADEGAEPLYDRDALRRARVIRTLEEELDVNLPGIGVILNLLEQFPR